MGMKLNKSLYLLGVGYIFNVLVFNIWYHTSETPIIDVIAVVAVITVLYLLLYFLIWTFNSLQKLWKSCLLVSIIAALIIILIQIVYHENYRLKRIEENKLTEEMRTKEEASMRKLSAEIDDANKTITVLIEMLNLKNNENDKLKRQLNKIMGKPKREAGIQAKSNKDFSEIQINSKATDIALDSKNQEIVFKVQIISSGSRLAKDSPHFNNVKNVWEYRESGLYKYTVGNHIDLKAAAMLQSELRGKGFSGAFVVAFKNGNRISVEEAKKFLN
jgi:N-acetylmuramoyl-L-alanine amidase